MDASAKLVEGYVEHGEIYCESCEKHIDLSTADTVAEARDIAIDHHRENHE